MATATKVKLLLSWEDETTRARNRESLLAAVILHLGLVVLILISPAVLAAPPTASAIDLQEQELTFLVLPPDLSPKPEQQDLSEEERQRMARQRSLTFDPQQLPYTVPAEPPGRPGQPEAEPTLPGPPGVGPPGTPAESEESNQVDDLTRLQEVPRITRRRESNSGLDLPLSRPGRVIEEELRRGQEGGGASVPLGDLGGINPNFGVPYPTILSETRGVDFGPYLIRLLRTVRANWYRVIPASVRWGEQGMVVIVFSIQKGGSVPDGQPIVVRSSGRSHLDRSALSAIRASQPFPPLPEEFTGEQIVLQFTFLYNLPLDHAGP